MKERIDVSVKQHRVNFVATKTVKEARRLAFTTMTGGSVHFVAQKRASGKGRRLSRGRKKK